MSKDKELAEAIARYTERVFAWLDTPKGKEFLQAVYGPGVFTASNKLFFRDRAADWYAPRGDR